MGIDGVDAAFDRVGFGRAQYRAILFFGILISIEPFLLIFLSVLAPLLECEWHLNKWETMGCVTIFLFSTAVGNVIWGIASDRLERRPILIITYLAALYFGYLTLFTSNNISLCIMAAILGFFVGGITPPGMTILSELSPNHYRAKAMMLMFCLWAIGGLVVLFSFLFSWKWTLLIGLVPYTLFTIFLQFLPASPRFLFVDGHPDEANRLLQKMAAQNGKLEEVNKLLPIVVAPNIKRGRLGDIFEKEILNVTVILGLVWFVSFFNYYGAVEMTAELPRRKHGCLQFNIPKQLYHAPDVVDDSCCIALNLSVYLTLVFTVLGDVVGSIINFFLLDYIGRKGCIFGLSILGAFSCCFLTVCGNHVITTILMFLLRVGAMGVLNGIILYTAEIYPTTVRTLSIGILSAAGHIGAGLATFFSLAVIKFSGVYTMMSFSIMYLIVAILALCLPVETNRRPMRQTLLRPRDHGWAAHGEYSTFKAK